MTEETIYADHDVTITTARITLTGTTYTVRNITSTKMTTTGPMAGGALIALVIAIIIGITGLFGLHT